MIRLVFLGRLADLAGAPLREVPAAGPLGLSQLFTLLEPALVSALSEERVKLALCGELVSRDSLIVSPGDELAFLPPVSGG